MAVGFLGDQPDTVVGEFRVRADPAGVLPGRRAEGVGVLVLLFTPLTDQDRTSMAALCDRPLRAVDPAAGERQAG
ncbi:hypothetical protein [Streptomyces sp. ID05-47C]|uniref:hypothetical protein n=1 Tax=Streptomyces sp. ID05-47C TaxID=3028665 RepID=UPI0029BA497C|nr:hypothetical protein [Streptomyces sp. ID05-47C]MDX3567990.1 hypothetical protein [Streptomyces sp. ID05-47C]